jgi:hypothetical protein
MVTINADVNDVNFEVDVNDITFNIDLGSNVAVASYVPANTPLYFNGNGGNTYLKYNSATSRLEVWVNGAKQHEWG